MYRLPFSTLLCHLQLDEEADLLAVGEITAAVELTAPTMPPEPIISLSLAKTKHLPNRQLYLKGDAMRLILPEQIRFLLRDGDLQVSTSMCKWSHDDPRRD
jgi:hypothetical protein